MKNLLHLWFIFCFIGNMQGQNVISYSYDNAGNRIKKEIVMSKMKDAKSDEQSYSEMLQKHDIHIYPNPTEGDLTISISNVDNSNQVSIMLYEVNGTLVKQAKLENGQAIMNIQNKAPGIYMMQISVDEKSTTWKIIKK